jgi:lysophospholipase L1-like esterase
MDIVLVCPPENMGGRPISMGVYRDYMYQVAVEQRCGFVDLFRVFGNSTSEYDQTSPRVLYNGVADTIHPAVEGHKQMAAAVLDYLLPST